jgi:NADH-quinone oxidoreductase subunit N
VKSLLDVHQEYLTGAFGLLVPEAVLVAVACVLFAFGLFVAKRLPAVALALAGVAGAAVAALLLGGYEIASFWQPVEGTPYDPRSVAPYDPTGPAAFIRWLSLAAAAVFLLLSWPEMRNDNAAEYSAFTLIIAAGASLVGRANDLVALFLALELVSIPTYVLLYLPVRTRAGQEAAVKYFLLSVLSSAVLLFGFSYLYGLTGTTNLGAMVATLSTAHQQSVSTPALIAAVMVIAGLGFRITAVPFHFYAPDVYEGGPTGVVAQLSIIPKVVGFIALARLLGLLAPPVDRLPFDAVHTLVPLTLWVIAVVTMTFGNVLALLQINLKRLLAYSGIAHGGYMLIGLLVALSLPESPGREPSQTGMDALLFYLVAYGLMTVGTFAVILYLSTADRPAETVDDLAGLGQTHPVTAASLAVMLFSLIGLPLTAGFVGKFLLFMAAFDAPTSGSMRNMYRILAVIAAVNAAIAAVYYLRVVGVMYLRSPLRPVESRLSGRPALSAAILCAVITVILGVYPKPLAEAARKAVPITDDRPALAVAEEPIR